MNDPHYTILTNGHVIAEQASIETVSRICDDLRFAGYDSATAIDNDGAETVIALSVPQSIFSDSVIPQE